MAASDEAAAPPPAAAPPSDNESSLVLAIDAAGRRLLLTGDLEGSALAAFAAAGPGVYDVLLAPHHGSRTSLPPAIAAATRPEWVLSSGRGGPQWPQVQAAYHAATRHPHAVVAQTGAGGAIRLDLSADRIIASRFTAGRWRPEPTLLPDASARPLPR